MFGAPLSARVGLRRGAFPCFEDRRTSENVVAPTGRIMNSCIASLLPAWLPPLMMLNAGTGMHIWSVGLPASCAICLYSGVFFAPAPALHTAIETARIALAPSLDLTSPHSCSRRLRTSSRRSPSGRLGPDELRGDDLIHVPHRGRHACEHTRLDYLMSGVGTLGRRGRDGGAPFPM